MKHLIFILSLAFVSLGCEHCEDCKERSEIQKVLDDTAAELVVIDGCEYYKYTATNFLNEIEHKGNCKFCQERQYEMMMFTITEAIKICHQEKNQ